MINATSYPPAEIQFFKKLVGYHTIYLLPPPLPFAAFKLFLHTHVPSIHFSLTQLEFIASNEHGNYQIPMMSILQETAKQKITPSKKITEVIVEKLVEDNWLVDKYVNKSIFLK